MLEWQFTSSCYNYSIFEHYWVKPTKLLLKSFLLFVFLSFTSEIIYSQNSKFNLNEKYELSWFFSDSIGNNYSKLAYRGKEALIVNDSQVTGFLFDSIVTVSPSHSSIVGFIDGIAEPLLLFNFLYDTTPILPHNNKSLLQNTSYDQYIENVIRKFLQVKLDSLKIVSILERREIIFFKGTTKISILFDYIKTEDSAVKFYLIDKAKTCVCTKVSPYFYLERIENCLDTNCHKYILRNEENSIHKTNKYKDRANYKEKNKKEFSQNSNGFISKEGVAVVFCGLVSAILFVLGVYIKSL